MRECQQERIFLSIYLSIYVTGCFSSAAWLFGFCFVDFFFLSRTTDGRASCKICLKFEGLVMYIIAASVSCMYVQYHSSGSHAFMLSRTDWIERLED